MIKRLLLATVLVAATAGIASAAPITGSFSLTSFGGSYVTGAGFTTTGATTNNATGLDFGLAFGTTGNGFGTNGTALIGNSVGSFVGLDGTFASVADIALGATANPYTVNPFISFGANSAIKVSFTDATVTRNANGIRVAGSATFTDGSVADTSIGSFNITTSTQSSDGAPTVNFTFTGNSGATAVPEPISMSVLGAGLVGMGLVRLRRKA